jgi:alanine-synthesizing transaminase
VKLSQRTGWIEQPSLLHRALAHARGSGRAVLDLTSSNPTLAGLSHPASVYESLVAGDVGRYEPHALGLPTAREAVAAYYARRGVTAAAERIWLCASTSEAYAQLFALVCDPGDAVLVPTPGYPLLDVIGDVAGVRRISYPLAYDGRWHIDVAGLRQALAAESRLRAVVVVSPNNPTGNYLAASELAALEAACVEHQIPLIVDEVFADYPLGDRQGVRHIEVRSCMAFVLSGLSKVAALPQMKLSWVVVHGPSAPADAVLARAEHLADACLSVSTPVQLALPDLLEAAEPMQARIRARLHTNLALLRDHTTGGPVELLSAEGGWTALLRLPQIGDRDAEGWAVECLERADVLVQPGHWFDLPDPPRVVLSLLTPSRDFEQGVARMLALVARSI